jgi:two-component system invasion response regulator UvrY
MHAQRFLLVDDDRYLRLRLRELLEEEYPSAAFVEAANAEEALVHATEGDPTVILLDCHMPGGSGMKALPELRARQPSIPIVMVSAAEAGQYSAAALRAGATAFVSKEGGLEDLVRVLRSLAV